MAEGACCIDHFYLIIFTERILEVFDWIGCASFIILTAMLCYAMYVLLIKYRNRERKKAGREVTGSWS